MRRIHLLPLAGLLLGSGCQQPQSGSVVGTLERHRIELRAERQEPILRLSVREGDQVATGDPVAALDPRRAAAQLAQAEAARDLSAARLAEVVRGARQEEIAQGRADLAEAEAALIESEPELRRMRNLVQDRVEPQAALDAAEAALAAARARRDALEAHLARLLNGATVEELDQARATLARDEREVERLRIDVDRLTIVAPRPGTIDALPFRVGDEPPVGSTVAVMLVEERPFARVYVSEELRPLISPGRRAAVAVDGYATPFEGRVRIISNEASFTPYFALTERDRKHLSYVAEIDLVGPEADDLPTGLPVEVTF